MEFAGIPVTVRRKSQGRKISVELTEGGGILVHAPRFSELGQIREFLRLHRDWIRAHVKRREQLLARFPAKVYVHGEIFTYLGRALRLHFVAATPTSTPKPVPKLSLRASRLVCEIPKSLILSGAHPEIASCIREFYKTNACQWIAARVKFWSGAMALFPSALWFREQKTRWGSCSSRGHLSLNWRLIVAPPEVIDYVIVHELAHLKYYDHSSQFWSLVARFAPNYRQAQAWLAENHFAADFLAAPKSSSEAHRRAG